MRRPYIHRPYAPIVRSSDNFPEILRRMRGAYFRPTLESIYVLGLLHVPIMEYERVLDVGLVYINPMVLDNDIEEYRAVIRHELVHALRSYKGKLAHMNDRSLRGTLVYIREEFWAYYMALRRPYRSVGSAVRSLWMALMQCREVRRYPPVMAGSTEDNERS